MSSTSTSSTCIIATASKLFSAQAKALEFISNQFTSNLSVQYDFTSSLNLMYHALVDHRAKIVVSGMGKSYKIAQKIVATMNSLGIHSVSLHPADALHGDLGVVHPNDVLIMITSSGNTSELLDMLVHLPASLKKICLTCNANSILARKSDAVLCASVPDSLCEKNLYGISAPTITTTACLAVGDAVCICLAEMLVDSVDERKANFGRRHPGGAIGLAYKESEKEEQVMKMATAEPENEEEEEEEEEELEESELLAELKIEDTSAILDGEFIAKAQQLDELPQLGKTITIIPDDLDLKDSVHITIDSDSDSESTSSSSVGSSAASTLLPSTPSDYDSIGIIPCQISEADEKTILRASLGKKWLLCAGSQLVSISDVKNALNSSASTSAANFSNIPFYDVTTNNNRT